MTLYAKFKELAREICYSLEYQTKLVILAPFACLKFGLFGLFFQPEQCFSLTTIQPEQCFSASFSQSSDQRMGPIKGMG